MKKLTRIAAVLVAVLLAMSGAFAQEAPADILGTINSVPVPLTDAQIEFSYYAGMYDMYGMADMIDSLRTQVGDTYMQYYAILEAGKARGFAVFSDEEMENLKTEAQANYDEVYNSYLAQFAGDGSDEKEAAAATVAFLESNNLTPETALTNRIDSEVYERLYASVTDGIEVAEEDVRALYDEYVSAQQAEYEEDTFNFEVDVMNGETPYYAPEGFRVVYHILLLMDDETREAYQALSEQRAENALAMEAEGADTEALKAEDERIASEMEALLKDLYDKAAEINRRLSEGEDFMDLMAEYGEDPGMQEEPYRSQGYYVAENSQVWDASFKEGAMAIESKGGVSEPVISSYGLHLILYADDVPSGAVDYESVREALTAEALENRRNDAWEAAMAEIMESADIVTYYDNLVYHSVDAGDTEAAG